MEAILVVSLCSVGVLFWISWFVAEFVLFIIDVTNYIKKYHLRKE